MGVSLARNCQKVDILMQLTTLVIVGTLLTIKLIKKKIDLQNNRI